MNNHFINNIKIENFKCFDNLHVDGIERVNLIGGKNNVGKTAFLEAVELLVSSNMANDLIINVFQMLMRRQMFDTEKPGLGFDFIKDDEKIITINTNNKTCSINLDSQTQNIIKTITLIFNINGEEKSFPIDNIESLNKLLNNLIKKRTKNLHINFIDTRKHKEKDIAILYGLLIDLDKESFLNDSLTKFDENIISLKIIPTEDYIVLKLKLKNEEQLVLLSSFGEGVNRYIAILCAIWASKDGFLFIDEVENGIHYTNYKKLWQIIFQASADANCQVFATTHSKECIEAFNDIQLEQEDGIYFELYNNVKKNIIMASKMDKNLLKYALTHKEKIRGE